jgi:hypothetical protein
VRAVHTDIRTNNAVFKTMFSFVNDFRTKLARKTARSSKRKRELDSLEDAEPSRKRAPPPTSSIMTPVPAISQTSSDLTSTAPAVSIAQRHATHLTTSFAPRVPRVVPTTRISVTPRISEHRFTNDCYVAGNTQPSSCYRGCKAQGRGVSGGSGPSGTTVLPRTR